MKFQLIGDGANANTSSIPLYLDRTRDCFDETVLTALPLAVRRIFLRDQEARPWEACCHRSAKILLLSKSLQNQCRAILAIETIETTRVGVG